MTQDSAALHPGYTAAHVLAVAPALSRPIASAYTWRARSRNIVWGKP